MITIIHGDDTASSRNLFYLEKAKVKEPIVFDKDNFDLTLLLQSLSGRSLFAEEKNIFLDNVFSLKKIPVERIKSLVSEVNKQHSPINIFIWEGSELGKTFLNQFPKAVVKGFKLPQSLFAFLDSIKPQSTLSIKLFHEALKTTDEIRLFSMIVRQFRLLLAIREGSDIEDFKRLSDWQRNKLSAQSRLFSIEQLKRVYKRLYKLDLEIKTGVQSNLTTAIDFFLLDL